MDGPSPNVARQSMPAGTPSGAMPASRPEDAAERAEERWHAAAVIEARIAYAAAAVAAVPAGLLLLVPILNATGALAVPAGVGTEDVWARSLLCLVLLLVALQLVSILLALEHRAQVAEEQALARELAYVWATRAAVAAAVVAAVLVATLGVPGWGPVALLGALAEALAVGWLLLARRGEPREVTRKRPPRDKPAPDVTGEGAVGLTVPADPRLLAIGASGGGIRAAAFVLGGHQAVQDTAEDLLVEDPRHEPAVFAVSGGSYVAAALALRRSFTRDGTRREPGPTPWRTAYATGSPELERLRRHTRYLFEPTWKTRDGLVSLVTGAAVNLLILGLVLRLVAWVASQLAVSIGLVGDDRRDERAELLDWAPGWDAWWQWWAVLAVPALCLLGIAAATLVGWRATAAFDRVPGVESPSDDAAARRRAMKRLGGAARWRTSLLFGGLGWLVLVVGVPAAAVGLTHLATHNQPTTLVASALRTAGFGTDGRCEDAFEQRVADAVDVANNLGRLSPGAEQEVSSGACGVEVTVKRTVDPETLTVIGPDEEALAALARDDSLPGQVVGVAALLALVVGLLRRGPSPEMSVTASRRARVKRVLLTWLPLLIVAAVAAYLLVLWTFGFLVGMDQGHLVWAVALTVAACVLAALVDANATSLHGFYRARLSDAFAVGVDDETRRADELPPGTVYRFSDLRPVAGDAGPRLHIVTTLNTRAPNQAPTMRGGFPLVLGPDHVEVPREEGRRVRVDTEAYENWAGPGRVSVMAAVATSGAALSPLMGRYGAQMAPYRFLLATFNVRVGAWVRNPIHTLPAPERPRQRPRFLWLTAKPGLVQVALEAFGTSSADRRWIYLSDGGHLDNTGLVECVRHCVDAGEGGRVLVLDASNDPVDSWSAVGDAIGVVRADLNIDLRRVSDPLEPPWTRRFQGGGLDVVVVKAVRTMPPPAGATGTDWWAVLPPNVQSFSLVNADFPRSSTLRQKFGDLEFEAYRGLGYACTRTAMTAAGWVGEA